MQRHRWMVSGGFAVLTAWMLVAGGCGARAYQKADRQELSMQAVLEDLGTGTVQIQKVTESLDQLLAAGAGGDARAAYDKFADALANIKTAEQTVKGRADALRVQSREYYAAWSESLEEIKDPELKESAEERQARAQETFAGLQAKFRAMREAYDPFMQDLEDLKLVLPNDLNPAGISAAAPTIMRAKTDGATVIARIGEATSALQSIQASKLVVPAEDSGDAAPAPAPGCE